MLDHIAAQFKVTRTKRKNQRLDSAGLARSITRTGSKQTYLITRLLVDKGLRDDCCRAYAYFRWADDVIDITAESPETRISFINQQLSLIDAFYRGEWHEALTAEEGLLADLIANNPSEATGLYSFIRNFIDLLEFDAHRKGQLINHDQLEWYTERLARAVTDGIQYFVGYGHPYPKNEGQYKAVMAAHIIHMLRDMAQDITEGYINIPCEYLEAQNIDTIHLDRHQMTDWVRQRVELARIYLEEGKRYLDSINVLRCKLAGYWYCARYEGVLGTIERDSYILRDEYRHGLSTLLKIIWLGLAIPVLHMFHSLIPSAQQRRQSQKLISH